MPTTPAAPGTPPRRRVAGIRRPRVAGRVPTAAEPAGASSVDVLAPPVDGPSVDVAPDEPRPVGKRRLRKGTGPDATAPRPRRPVPTVVLAGVLVVLVTAAVFFGVAAAGLRDTPAARNTALTDVGTTAQVTQQLTDALKAVYSFDFARLDQNEADARAVITPEFTAQFDQLFGQVRELAPQQQAVVTATVASSAVREIDGDRAVMVVFLDQQATRAQAGTETTQLAAAGRLTVTGVFVDGRWKISNVQAQ